MFSITTNSDGVLVLSGRFDAAQGRIAEPIFDKISASVVLDLSDLDYISSMGLGIIISAYKRLNDKQCTITLRNPSKHVRDVFHYTSLEKLFIIE
jgi:anti-anti-sigma factor